MVGSSSNAAALLTAAAEQMRATVSARSRLRLNTLTTSTPSIARYAAACTAPIAPPPRMPILIGDDTCTSALCADRARSAKDSGMSTLGLARGAAPRGHLVRLCKEVGYGESNIVTGRGSRSVWTGQVCHEPP